MRWERQKPGASEADLILLWKRAWKKLWLGVDRDMWSPIWIYWFFGGTNSFDTDAYHLSTRNAWSLPPVLFVKCSKFQVAKPESLPEPGCHAACRVILIFVHHIHTPLPHLWHCAAPPPNLGSPWEGEGNLLDRRRRIDDHDLRHGVILGPHQDPEEVDGGDRRRLRVQRPARLHQDQGWEIW